MVGTNNVVLATKTRRHQEVSLERVKIDFYDFVIVTLSKSTRACSMSWWLTVFLL